MNLSKALLIFLPIFHPVFNAFENEVFFLLPIDEQLDAHTDEPLETETVVY